MAAACAGGRSSIPGGEYVEMIHSTGVRSSLGGRLDGHGAGRPIRARSRRRQSHRTWPRPNTDEKTPVISSVALDPAGKLLAAVGDDHLVRVFDIPERQDRLHRWKSHTDWVKASAFRPDGQVLATSGTDRRIRLWDVPSQDRPRDLSEQSAADLRLAYSPDGRMLAVAGFGDKVWIFDADQGTVAPRVGRAGQRHPCGRASRPTARGWPRRAAPGWSAFGRPAAAKQVADVQVSSRRICALAYSPDGRYLAAAGQQRIVRLLDAVVGQAGGRSAGAAGRSAGALLLRARTAGLGRQRQRDSSLGRGRPPGAMPAGRAHRLDHHAGLRSRGGRR